MSVRIAAGWIVLGVLLAAGTATAQLSPATPEATTTATEPEPAPEPAPAPLEPGISQYTPPAWVAIQRGHRAYLARDFDTALAAYREAAMATPPLSIAHYFIGAAQRAKGQLDEAIESFRTVSRLAGEDDPELKAKGLFNIAVTYEMKNDLRSAREAWLEYKTWCTTHTSTPGFPQIADERVAAIDAVVQLNETFEAVRQRIADRERVVAEEAAAAP